MPWSLLSKESQTYRFPCLEAWRLPSQGSRLFELFASNELTPLEAPAPGSTAAAHALNACQSLIFPIQPEADAAEVSCVSVTPKGKPLLPDDLLRKNKPKQLLDIVL